MQPDSNTDQKDWKIELERAFRQIRWLRWANLVVVLMIWLLLSMYPIE
jgi:hypothetical protein